MKKVLQLIKGELNSDKESLNQTKERLSTLSTEELFRLLQSKELSDNETMAISRILLQRDIIPI